MICIVLNHLCVIVGWFYLVFNRGTEQSRGMLRYRFCTIYGSEHLLGLLAWRSHPQPPKHHKTSSGNDNSTQHRQSSRVVSQQCTKLLHISSTRCRHEMNAVAACTHWSQSWRRSAITRKFSRFENISVQRYRKHAQLWCGCTDRTIWVLLGLWLTSELPSNFRRGHQAMSRQWM